MWLTDYQFITIIILSTMYGAITYFLITLITQDDAIKPKIKPPIVFWSVLWPISIPISIVIVFILYVREKNYECLD